jgi:hypothetical protein
MRRLWRARTAHAAAVGGGWNMNLQYNFSRQRPPRGGTQILNDPEALCEGQRVFGNVAYDLCRQRAVSAPTTGLTTGQAAIGAPVYITPPTQNISGSMSFNITPKWAAQWSTQYDVTRARFASQQLGLQRELHDWNAVFSFSQTTSGNFAFSFFIALKAQPNSSSTTTARPTGPAVSDRFRRRRSSGAAAA